MSANTNPQVKTEQIASPADSSTDDLFYQNIVRAYLGAPRFVRRDWLASDLKGLLAQAHCRFVLLTSEPGAGKSSFIAQLANDNPTWPGYFIRKNQRESMGELSTKSFLLRIGFQLAAIYPELFELDQLRIEVEQCVGEVSGKGQAVGAEIDRVFASPFHQKVIYIKQQIGKVEGRATGIRIGELVSDPRLLEQEDLQEMALLRPARSLLRLKPAEQIVILVDALDELVYHNLEHDLLDWLTSCPPLPENVRIVLSSRPTKGALVKFKEARSSVLLPLFIRSTDERVTNELETYAAELVNPPEIAAALAESGRTQQDFVHESVGKAEGNIGYLAAVGRALDRLRAKPQFLKEFLALKQLPDDMSALFSFFLHQIKNTKMAGTKSVTVRDPQSGRAGIDNAWTAVYRPMLAVLAVAREPLTVVQLQALTGTLADRDYLIEALEWLDQFLDTLGSSYRLYHATFAEFLTDNGTRTNVETQDLYVDAAQTHKQLARELETSGSTLAMWEDSLEDAIEQAKRNYARSHYITHLYIGSDWTRLFAVTDEGVYGREKLRWDPSTYSYSLDLDLAIRAATREGLLNQNALGLLPKLWTYKLLRSTIASYADVLPPITYTALVLLGRDQEATRLAELVTRNERQAVAFSALARGFAMRTDQARMATYFIQQGYDTTLLIQDAEQRNEVLWEMISATSVLVETTGSLEPRIAKRVAGIAREMAADASVAELVGAIASLLHRVGNETEALSIINQLNNSVAKLTDPKQSSRMLAQLIESYGELGEFARAQQLADTIVPLDQRIVALAKIAAAQHAKGADSAAGSTLDLAMSIANAVPNPGIKAFALQKLGEEQFSRGQTELGLALLREALRFEQERADKRAGTGNANAIAYSLWQMRDREGALQALELVRTAAIESVSARKTESGQGYSLSLPAIDAARLCAALDQVDSALEIAEILQPWEQYSVLEAVVSSLARQGDIDQALAVTGRFKILDSRSSVRIGAGRTIDSIPFDSESASLSEIAAALATHQRWDEAIGVAERITGVQQWCYAMSSIALCQYEAGSTTAAAELMNRVTRRLNLQRSSAGKDEALLNVLNLLVVSKDWALAKELASGIAISSIRDHARAKIAEALIESGELLAAEESITLIQDAFRRATTLVVLARKQAESLLPGQVNISGPVALTLDRARKEAGAVEEGASRSEVLRTIALAYHELRVGQPGAASDTFGEAVDAWSKAAPYRFLPTPVGDICLTMAKLGHWDWAIKTARGLVQHNRFDGCSALQQLAEYSWASGLNEQADQLIQEAKVAATQVDFPPMKDGALAEVAGRYASMGKFDEARSPDLLTPSSRPAASERIAAELARIGRVDEALAAISGIGDTFKPGRAWKAIAEAYLSSGHYEQALPFARRMDQPSDQVEIFVKTASALFGLGRAAEANRLLDEAIGLAQKRRGFGSRGSQLERVITCLLQSGEQSKSVTTIQQEWRGAADREALLDLIPMARPLAKTAPELGRNMFASFRWIDEFLGSV